MRKVKEKSYEYDGFVLHTIATDQFKNGYLEVNFRQDISECTPSKRNMLGVLMKYSTSSCKTNRELKIACENLYDISFSQGTSRVGYNLITSFSLDFLHPKYVSEKSYIKKAFHFFFDALEHPNIENGKWDEQSFDIIKELILSNIDLYKERPTSYAMVESKKRLFQDSCTGQRIIGTKETVEALTPESVAQDYQEMFEKSICEIILVGDFDMDEMAKLINQCFYKPCIVEKTIESVVPNKIIPYKEEEQSSSYTQTQIVQYYISEPLTKRERDYVAPVFQQITGLGSLSDKLGYYLRMKNSLCYSYYSTFAMGDSYFVISTGIKEENKEKALKCFHQVMEEMKKGIISKEDLETKKTKILTNVKMAMDNIYGIAENCYNHHVLDHPSFENTLKEIPTVTIKELKSLAMKLHKSYTFILKEGEAHERD